MAKQPVIESPAGGLFDQVGSVVNDTRREHYDRVLPSRYGTTESLFNGLFFEEVRVDQ